LAPPFNPNFKNCACAPAESNKKKAMIVWFRIKNEFHIRTKGLKKDYPVIVSISQNETPT
jgi:hypothetical protein